MVKTGNLRVYRPENGSEHQFIMTGRALASLLLLALSLFTDARLGSWCCERRSEPFSGRCTRRLPVLIISGPERFGVASVSPRQTLLSRSLVVGDGSHDDNNRLPPLVLLAVLVPEIHKRLARPQKVLAPLVLRAAFWAGSLRGVLHTTGKTGMRPFLRQPLNLNRRAT